MPAPAPMSGSSEEAKNQPGWDSGFFLSVEHFLRPAGFEVKYGFVSSHNPPGRGDSRGPGKQTVLPFALSGVQMRIRFPGSPFGKPAAPQGLDWEEL